MSLEHGNSFTGTIVYRLLRAIPRGEKLTNSNEEALDKLRIEKYMLTAASKSGMHESTAKNSLNFSMDS